MLRILVFVCAALLLNAAPQRRRPAAPARTRPSPLAVRIDRLTASTAAARQAFWGLRVVDLAAGRQMVGRNEQKLFIPASNTKLFTTALALLRLGPEHRFSTVVSAPAAPDSEGRVTELRLVGGGDPNLSGRTIPYQAGGDEISGEPLRYIEELADRVVERGLRRIEGDVVGDDRAYVWEPYPDGWAQDDAVWEYGAPVSALTVNDNAFRLKILPGASGGDLARLELAPAFEYLVIHNHVRSTGGGERKIAVERLAGSRELTLAGVLPLRDRGAEYKLAVDDPALFAAAALRDALVRRGVVVTGSAVARHRYPWDQPAQAEAGVELARHTSAPLLEILRVADKVSQNLHVEIVLRELARQANGVGSRVEGLKLIRAFLEEMGVDARQFRFADASGLSRLTRVTPETITTLLAHMWTSPRRDAWVSLLPVGGRDGTLEHRFSGILEGRFVHAKTGTISSVSALSGYVLAPAGRPYAFSLVVNHYNGQSGEVRRIMDQIVAEIIRHSHSGAQARPGSGPR
ncbi:MAG: D-alanyl-D-alanine carboxypeptidase/D-alanyl-D-alanine-endopeptidase [Acidobacteria bacterium]|nr:D-alanyl-D-alanine carboxypeptidase/D-alanyl-D-alanine-endopeptidase [Acidobacteriota bacterium]